MKSWKHALHFSLRLRLPQHNRFHARHIKKFIYIFFEEFWIFFSVLILFFCHFLKLLDFFWSIFKRFDFSFVIFSIFLSSFFQFFFFTFFNIFLKNSYLNHFPSFEFFLYLPYWQRSINSFGLWSGSFSPDAGTRTGSKGSHRRRSLWSGLRGQRGRATGSGHWWWSCIIKVMIGGQKSTLGWGTAWKTTVTIIDDSEKKYKNLEFWRKNSNMTKSKFFSKLIFFWEKNIFLHFLEAKLFIHSAIKDHVALPWKISGKSAGWRLCAFKENPRSIKWFMRLWIWRQIIFRNGCQVQCRNWISDGW